MELHEHFINIARKETLILEIIGQTSSLQKSFNSVITSFTENCLESLKKNHCIDKKNLELLRIVLCHHYKLEYEDSQCNKNKLHLNSSHEFMELIVNGNVSIQNENQAILLDTIILFLVIFEDQRSIVCLLEALQSSKTTDKVSTSSYLKIVKCFLSAWEIHHLLSNNKVSNITHKNHLESCKKVLITLALYDLQFCTQYTENDVWYALRAVVSKIINIAGNTEILSPYVKELLNSETALMTLCILCDYIFPTNTKNINVDYSLLRFEKLWCLIRQNLVSDSPQYQKQALHLLKRTFIFIEANVESIIEEMPLDQCANKLNQFIYPETIPTKYTMKEIRTNFILIMEALEEKQKHLIIPSLSFANDLIKSWTEHELNISSFDYSWTPCVFIKLLQHDSNVTVKWGLEKLLSLNEKAYYNPEIIVLILKYLNNTFLYEKFNNEDEPEIVYTLTKWLNNSQNEQLDKINLLLSCIHKVSWNPVAIFYVLRSILISVNDLNETGHLSKSELKPIKTLIDANIKYHVPILRSASQVTIIKIVAQFFIIEFPNNLCDFLSTFSFGELKEQYYWPPLTAIMSKMQYKNATEFICKVCNDLIVDDKNVRIAMPTFAIIIQSLYQGKIIFQDEQCLAIQKLKSLFLSLDKVDVRPYVKVSLIMKIVELIYSLLDLESKPPDFIFKIFMNYVETVFKFILKLFYNSDLVYEHVEICSRTLQRISYLSNSKSSTISILTNYNSNELEEKCMQVLSNDGKHTEVQLLLALQVWSRLPHVCKYENKYFIKKIITILGMCKSKERKTEFKGRIGLDFYVALCKLIKSHILTTNVDDLKIDDNWLSILSSIFDVVGIEAIIYFADIIKLYTTFVEEDDKKLEEIKILTNSFCNSIFCSKREKTFWIAARKLTMCVNSTNFVNCLPLRDISEDFNQRILKEGESLPGLVYIFLTCSDISKNFDYFMTYFLNGLTFGQGIRRDQRITMQTSAKAKIIVGPYVLKDGNIENFEIYEFINRTSNIDATVRAAAIVQLCKAIMRSSPAKESVSTTVLGTILKILANQQGKRYFADSPLHRQKLRLLQALLIIQPYLSKDLAEVLYNNLCESMIVDSDQHSVRLLKEWLITRICLAHKEFLSSVWDFFQKIYEKRPNSVSYVIGIISHIAHALEDQERKFFLKNALSKLAVCCMSHQFSMRLFGQVFFIKLYELLHHDWTVFAEFGSIYDTVTEILNEESLKKNRIKLEDDFYYACFDPIKHYSLETIFYHIPRLTNVSPEELITTDIFKEQITFARRNVEINVTNPDYELNKFTIPYSLIKSGENSKPEEVEYTAISTDIQKKITPWKSMLPNEEELERSLGFKHLKDKSSAQNVIVVASFIEKPQNLGGIARTCEIFGVKELVISNLKITEDKEFKALSVTADKWLNIVEIRTSSLITYLEEVKNAGWTLIGAEQTANSSNLFEYQFPKQIVIVLGNEKNGIPANIIPLLDTCVEIPQFGIIRSLNVHVTNAIFIWEYIKQHQIT